MLSSEPSSGFEPSRRGRVCLNIVNCFVNANEGEWGGGANMKKGATNSLFLELTRKQSRVRFVDIASLSMQKRFKGRSIGGNNNF